MEALALPTHSECETRMKLAKAKGFVVGNVVAKCPLLQMYSSSYLYTSAIMSIVDTFTLQARSSIKSRANSGGASYCHSKKIPTAWCRLPIRCEWKLTGQLNENRTERNMDEIIDKTQHQVGKEYCSSSDGDVLEMKMSHLLLTSYLVRDSSDRESKRSQRWEWGWSKNPTISTFRTAIVTLPTEINADQCNPLSLRFFDLHYYVIN